MFKKMMVLFVLAFSLATVAVAANPQMPPPTLLSLRRRWQLASTCLAFGDSRGVSAFCALIAA